MAPTAKPGPAASADNTAADSNRSDTQSTDSANDNIPVVVEQLQLLHTRMDKHARDQSEMLRRDTLRDHPVAIGTAAPSPVDAPYRLTCEFVPAPQREHTQRQHQSQVHNRPSLSRHDGGQGHGLRR
jgi:hypothetical protein